MNIERGKSVCDLYRQGLTLTEVAKTLGISHSQVEAYLKTYYKKIYDEDFVPYAKKQAKVLSELYQKYQDIYVPGVYTRKTLCKALDCDVHQLEAMLRRYRLKNQWLKTYAGQVTLCNTSKEFRNSVSEFVKAHGFKSVREFTIFAINEMMLYLKDKEE